MRRIISFMHISLDGFVSGPNGELNWAKVDEELFSYVGQRIAKTDTALYGRNTYQMMESYWPTASDKPNATKHDIEHSEWYKNVHKIVLSRTLAQQGQANTEIITGDVVKKIDEIRQQPGEEVLLFGSPTATHALLKQNLIDGFWLFVNPVVLGKGIRLFEGIENLQELELLGTKQFTNGVTELNYVVTRARHPYS